MATSHASWENWEAAWEGPPQRVVEWTAVDFEYNAVSAELAGEELVEMLLHLKISGVLSAKSCCELAWWAHRAGAVGPVPELGTKPWQRTGESNRHLDKWTGVGP